MKNPYVVAMLAAWLAERHDDGAVLCSVCAGAFVLAETGLLAGRSATTHWTYLEELTRRFPACSRSRDCELALRESQGGHRRAALVTRLSIEVCRADPRSTRGCPAAASPEPAPRRT